MVTELLIADSSKIRFVAVEVIVAREQIRNNLHVGEHYFSTLDTRDVMLGWLLQLFSLHTHTLAHTSRSLSMTLYGRRELLPTLR